MGSDRKRLARLSHQKTSVLTEVSAGGVLFEDGKLLVLRKPNGEWVMPKGHVEADETPEQAALREVEEETGLKGRIRGKIGQTQYEFRVPQTGAIHRKRVHWFLMDVLGGSLDVERTFSAGRFVTVDEAMKTLTFANDREMVRRALALMKKSGE